MENIVRDAIQGVILLALLVCVIVGIISYTVGRVVAQREAAYTVTHVQMNGLECVQKAEVATGRVVSLSCE